MQYSVLMKVKFKICIFVKNSRTFNSLTRTQVTYYITKHPAEREHFIDWYYLSKAVKKILISIS